MRDWFFEQNAVFQAFLAGLFTWAITTLGAGTVFLTRQVRRRVLDGMLGFAGGVMIAASLWSLLAPAIALAEERALPAWFSPAVGFLLGGAALWGIDRVFPHRHPGLKRSEAEGPTPGPPQPCRADAPSGPVLR
jgi:ZIP family zinc transporter